MRILVQKCNKGSVSIENPNHYEEIGLGLVVFVGFTDGDNMESIQFLARKLVNLRIFEDEQGIMNRSVLDVGGSVLSISQFTLYADTSKGNRPSYMKALNPSDATLLYDLWNQELSRYVSVKTGVFGADMVVDIQNMGPTTIFLEK